jgi:exonuclease SbcD
MRIFHLADLHLGKSIHERDLLEDQRHALDAVLCAVGAESPACVLIAGDVFDRSVPTAEAVTLFGSFAAAIKAIDPGIAIVVIPGNHDSAARLGFMATVLAQAGVHIASDPESCDSPVVVENGGDRTRFWLLPFLTPGAFHRESPVPDLSIAGQAGLFDEPEPILRSQADMFAEAMRRIGEAMSGERTRDQTRELDSGTRAADVLVCHAFARGGLASESERVFLGTAELVDGTAFDAFDYVALGHLHRPQAVGSRGRYPGSILAYSFSESDGERGFLSVELSPGSSLAEFRPISPLRRMVRFHGSYDRVLSDPALSVYEGDYVEAVLDDADAVLNPMEALRRRFPNILSLRQAAFERTEVRGVSGAAGRSEALSIADEFAAFHREVREVDPEQADAALFAELCEEASREAP